MSKKSGFMPSAHFPGALTLYTGKPEPVYSPDQVTKPETYLDDREYGQVRTQGSGSSAGETILATIQKKSILVLGTVSFSFAESIGNGTNYGAVELRIRNAIGDIVLLSVTHNGDNQPGPNSATQVCNPIYLVLLPGDQIVEKHAIIQSIATVYFYYQVGFVAQNLSVSTDTKRI